jgi:hypothetical protein
VAIHSAQLAKMSNLSKIQSDALFLGAVWHDVSRTIFTRPSIIVMPFVDDALSACILFHTAIRLHLATPTVRLAMKIILCKNMGAKRFLPKIILRKNNHILVDILQDADTLDVLNQERLIGMMDMVGENYLYRVGYKLAIHFYLVTNQLKMKTEQARKIAISELKKFVEWMKSTEVYVWHITRYGKKWMDEMLMKASALIYTMEMMPAS